MVISADNKGRYELEYYEEASTIDSTIAECQGEILPICRLDRNGNYSSLNFTKFQEQKQLAVYRRLFMDIEREQVRENLRMKEHRKRMTK